MIPELVLGVWLLVYPPAAPLTLFPDQPDWYVLDIGDTGCERYGWPVPCGTARQTVDQLTQNLETETDDEN